MKDLVRKFLKPVDFIFDSFVGTLSTAKAYLFLEKHRRFVKFENEYGCVEKLMVGLLEAYACQQPNDKFYLKGA